MERLWSPWRYAYVAASGAEPVPSGCVFCELPKNPADDEQNLILYRGEHNFIILNRYPYTSGHLMIAPFAHLGDFDAAPKSVTDEMMDLAKRAQTILRKAYHPEGFNLGMNFGRVAGAGIPDHIHMHLMPRWIGDTSFMTTVAETRVLPEDLQASYRKLRGPDGF
jgi:ATP adenylyltransferase